MAYCSKCGAKLEEDDIYCPNCGTKRIDIDNGHMSVKQKNMRNINVNINFKSVIEIFINMLLKPVTTAKRFINGSKKDTAIILTIFIVIINGLLGMWKVNQIFSNINDVAIKFINKIYEISKFVNPGSTTLNGDDMNGIVSEIGKIKSIVKIPYGEIFLQNCALILISILVIFIMLCLVNTLLSKNKPQIFKFYKTAIIVTMPIIYFKFLSVIFSYLSIDIGIALALFGFMVSLVCFAMVVNESLKIPENCILYIVSFTVLVVVIIAAVCLQKFIVSDIGNIVSSIMNNANI